MSIDYCFNMLGGVLAVTVIFIKKLLEVDVDPRHVWPSKDALILKKAYLTPTSAFSYPLPALPA